jgi:hypothetical protein
MIHLRANIGEVAAGTIPSDRTPILIADILAVGIVMISIRRTTADALHLMRWRWRSRAIPPAKRARRAVPKLT